MVVPGLGSVFCPPPRVTTREFEKSLRIAFNQANNYTKSEKFTTTIKYGFLLRTFAGKYLFPFVIEIPIQILIIFTLRVWAARTEAS